MSLTLQQIAESLELEFRGDGGIEISGVASLPSASVGDLSFIQQKSYLKDLAASECGAVILPAALAGEAGARALLISENPQYSFVQVIQLLGIEPEAKVAAGIHPSAQLADSASLGKDVSIGALVVVGNNVSIGSGTTIGAGSVIEDDVVIGKDCRLHARVTLNHSVRLGDRCELHSGVVVGSDGFGLAHEKEEWHKVPQLGTVDIHDDVEIGANTAIDRGALDDTIIEQGCKLDNQIHVAHNVHIGAHTAIAACVGIAGSAKIGSYCKISGGVGILGHLSIADNVTITAMSLVTKEIREAGVYSSGTPLQENEIWHRNNARYKNLDKLAETVAQLKKSD